MVDQLTLTDPAIAVTRRHLMALGLAAAAGVRAAPALAAGAPRSASVVLRLPYARRIGPVRVPGGLELAGLRWPGRAHLHGELRARRRGGRWTPGLPLHAGGDHAPDGGAHRRTAPRRARPARRAGVR